MAHRESQASPCPNTQLLIKFHSPRPVSTHSGALGISDIVRSQHTMAQQVHQNTTHSGALGIAGLARSQHTKLLLRLTDSARIPQVQDAKNSETANNVNTSRNSQPRQLDKLVRAQVKRQETRQQQARNKRNKAAHFAVKPAHAPHSFELLAFSVAFPRPTDGAPFTGTSPTGPSFP